MRVAVTATGKTPEVQVEPRFSRCNYFVIWDMQTEQWEFVPNPRLTPEGRSGKQVARELADRKVICVVTGRVGPNAQVALQAMGIDVYCIGICGTVREALNRYREEQLKMLEPTCS
ncbi:MAG: NifB/NifX family molybdenum-iron cluster-binding protein [Bacillota bacterium]